MPLTVLRLTGATVRVLERCGLHTVGSVLEVASQERLSDLRNVGVAREAEIMSALAQVTLLADGGLPDSSVEEADESAFSRHLVSDFLMEEIQHLCGLIRKQLVLGQLHTEVLVFNGSILDWLNATAYYDRQELLNTLWNIVSGPSTVCEELENILGFLLSDSRLVKIFHDRYCEPVQTLEQIGEDLQLTRERVRQLAVKIEEHIQRNLRHATTVRMQSALLLARELEDALTLDSWVETVERSGLLGKWNTEYTEHSKLMPIDTFVAVCRIASISNNPELRVPKNLFAVLDRPGVNARIASLVLGLPKKTSKLIVRHSRLSGAVYVQWLARRISMQLDEAVGILEALGYVRISDDWFVEGEPPVDTDDIDRMYVFHNTMRKMIQYCGTLTAEELCTGLRNVLSRHGLPTPPPSVVSMVLVRYGFTSVDGKFDWPGEFDAILSKSEQTIISCLDEYGPVVHHQELHQAFRDNDLSLPGLHKVVTHSPLFTKVDTGLYKLIGVKVSTRDIARAKLASERVTVDLQTEYKTSGDIILEATLGPLAVSLGTIYSERLPNLVGEWDLNIDGELDVISVTDNEVRHLRRAFEHESCSIGDRVRVTFNTWTRTVIVTKCES